MTDRGTMHEDLRYVREVVGRADGSSNPATVYYLWAVLTFFGYAIIDFAPEWCGAYWMIAGPAGGLLSGWLGWRESRAMGQDSRREGRLHTLHWTGMMVAILLTIPLEILGMIQSQAIPRIVLLLVAFAYYAIGIFEDRKMLWVGMIVAAAYAASLLLRDFRWVWTVSAAGIAAALIVAGIMAASAARPPRGTAP